MRIVTIEGAAGVGKSYMLKVLADHAGRKIISGNDFVSMLRLHKSKLFKIELQLESFVDEVSPAQKKVIEDFSKDYSNDYVVVMVKAA